MDMEARARRGATSAAKLMALMCVEQSKLEKFRQGLCPVTRTGDYSDVVVVDGDGRIIPWQRVARFDADEIRETMRDIVDKLYTCFLNIESPEFTVLRDHQREDMWEWDRPRKDPGLMKQMEVLASGLAKPGIKAAPSQDETET